MVVALAKPKLFGAPGPLRTAAGQFTQPNQRSIVGRWSPIPKSRAVTTSAESRPQRCAAATLNCLHRSPEAGRMDRR